MRDFLTVEDALTHPHFSAECDAMETFLSDLAGAKEMFDVSVYHDVKAMLRMHRERMMEMERERNEVVTYKVPSYSTTEYTTESCGSRAAGVTYRMPSFSTAESELRARVFSPAQGARGAETDATSVGGMEGWDDYGDGDTADVFHGGWSPVRTSERDYGSAVARGKRPAARAAAQRPGHAPTKRLRRTEQEEEPTWLKEKTPETTDLPTSSRSHGYNQNDDLQDLVARSDSTPKSGSLIPPEIADFDTLDEGEAPLPTTRTTTTTRKTKKAKTTTWKNDIAIDSNDDENDPLQKFYPGDPVFMFGETKYLQALQSRRMEKDLAGGGWFSLLFLHPLRSPFPPVSPPHLWVIKTLTCRTDDEETQAAIDARPLMGMFARFRLPDAGTAAVVGEGREMGRVGVVGGRREGRGGMCFFLFSLFFFWLSY